MIGRIARLSLSVWMKEKDFAIFRFEDGIVHPSWSPWPKMGF
jgi:hypothetical protein